VTSPSLSTQRKKDDSTTARDFMGANVFFRTSGDIGRRVAYYSRLSGKPPPMSQPGGGFLLRCLKGIFKA
jgi:hypothetical protein